MVPGSPTTSGSARQYLRQNVTRLKLVSGTTLAIATPSICARDSPSSASRWSSQTTYSSAVRLPSVAVRQLPFSTAPSHTANEVFVLLELIASSIGPLLSAPFASNGSRENLAGGDPAVSLGRVDHQTAALVEIEKPAEQRRPLQPNPDLRTETGGAGQPRLADRSEAFGAPDPHPEVESPDIGLQERLRTDFRKALL